jgi:hypothetical protein
MRLSAAIVMTVSMVIAMHAARQQGGCLHPETRPAVIAGFIGETGPLLFALIFGWVVGGEIIAWNSGCFDHSEGTGK